jgi:hypothetical protein
MTAMKRGLCVLSALALVGWPAAAEARQLPTTAQVERALNMHEACRAAGNMACHTPLHYRLTRSRCLDLEDPNNPGRILCLYWGVLSGLEAPPQVLRHDCAYFKRDAAGIWRVDAYPDADMCEE